MEPRFRDRFVSALDASGLSVAELSRRSGVSYHVIDKLKKRPGASTTVENANKLAQTLGMSSNYDPGFHRLTTIYLQLPPEKQAMLLKLAEAFLA